jgi:hypothetical protein
MSEDNKTTSDADRPANPDKRQALKKLGRFAAYTAPATLVLLGYTAATKEGFAALSGPPSPPPPSPEGPPPPP